MGWTSYNMTEPIKEWFKSQWSYDGSDYEVVDSALVRRQTLYGAIRQKSTGDVFCAVFLVRWTRGYYNFSYKDMTEHAGPYEIECPEKIFKLLTPLNDKNDASGYARGWRERVQKFHETRKKLRSGCVIKTKEPIEFTNGERYQLFMKEGRKFYTAVRLCDKYKTDDTKYVTDIHVRFNPLHYGFELIEN